VLGRLPGPQVGEQRRRRTQLGQPHTLHNQDRNDTTSATIPCTARRRRRRDGASRGPASRQITFDGATPNDDVFAFITDLMTRCVNSRWLRRRQA
jgi:hypothetical protein